MCTKWQTRRLWALAVLLVLAGTGSRLRSEEPHAVNKVVLPTLLADSRATSALLRVDTLPKTWRLHPLAPALLFAAQHQQGIDEQVQDFACILVKRERIDGQLRDYEYLRTKFRRQVERQGTIVKPFAAYTEFLAPAKVRGRKVLYVAGENGGKMLVRNGGTRFSYMTLKLDPHGEAALRESHYPITELGLNNVVMRLIEQGHDDMLVDPTGLNTEVQFFREAKIDNRSCTHIRVTHPRKNPDFHFHIANIYIDDELHVPIRVESWDWPNEEGAPQLFEEYTYTKLRLNVGLTDADFDPSLLTQ